MTRDEYDLVRELAKRHAGSTAVQDACGEVADQFDQDRSVGMIRLLTGAEDAGLPRANIRGEDFREVLAELFPKRKDM